MAGSALTSKVSESNSNPFINKAIWGCHDGRESLFRGKWHSAGNPRGPGYHARRAWGDGARCSTSCVIEMAPFGKVHSAVHNAADRVKSGLKWANHQYQQGVGLAGKVNDLYHVGKKVAGLMMPTLDKMHPALAPRINAPGSG